MDNVPKFTAFRRTIVIKRIVLTVEEYYDSFNTPIPMRVLSAKFAKALLDMGGFPEVIRELSKDKLISIKLYRGGARVVYPISEKEKVKLASRWL